MGLCAKRQQPVAQLPFKAIHDRKDHEQCCYPKRDAGQRHPGDQRNEEFLLPRAHIAQADKHWQRLKHGERIKAHATAKLDVHHRNTDAGAAQMRQFFRPML